VDYVISSPFKRCLQTSAGVVRGLPYLPQGHWLVDWQLAEVGPQWHAYPFLFCFVGYITVASTSLCGVHVSMCGQHYMHLDIGIT
jgi:hypothetical protein